MIRKTLDGSWDHTSPFSNHYEPAFITLTENGVVIHLRMQIVRTVVASLITSTNEAITRRLQATEVKRTKP